MDGQAGEYDLDDEAVLYDCQGTGPAAVYRRSGELTSTPLGHAAVYVYVGPSLLG